MKGIIDIDIGCIPWSVVRCKIFRRFGSLILSYIHAHTLFPELLAMFRTLSIMGQANLINAQLTVSDRRSKMPSGWHVGSCLLS